MYLSHLHVFVFAYVSVFVYTCICIRTFIYICVCICTKTCICICICSVYVFVYVSACEWCVLILKCPSALDCISGAATSPICMSSRMDSDLQIRTLGWIQMDLDLNHSSGLKNNWHSAELREKDLVHICILLSLIMEDCAAAGGIFSFCSCLN